MTIRTPVATPKNSITVAGKTIYLNNKELLAEVKRSKEKGEMTNELAMMLQKLCSRYAKKGNFINYSYNEDMQGYAMMMLVRTWNSFNPEKSSNPFAFFTQCIKNSFVQYLNVERKQRDTRDALLVDQGMSPSFGFSDGTSHSGIHMEDEQNLDLTIFDILSDIQSAFLPDAPTSTDDAPIERDERGTELSPTE